jgi:hypothetical protein
LFIKFAAKEKLEIVLSFPVQGEAGGRGVRGEFRVMETREESNSTLNTTIWCW